MIKYKRIDLKYLIKELNTNNKMFIYFFNIYLNEYITKLLNLHNINDYIRYNINYLEKYRKIDRNADIYYHILIDKDANKIIGIFKTLKISDNFFTLKYFKLLKIEYNIHNNLNIYYGVNLFILQEYRGQNLCFRLNRKIIQKAIKKDIKYIICEIHNNNIASQKCFLKVGFQKTNILSYKDSYFYIIKL